jgi:hypothetical protein
MRLRLLMQIGTTLCLTSALLLSLDGCAPTKIGTVERVAGSSASILALRSGDITATEPQLIASGASDRHTYIVLQSWEYARIPALRAAQPGVKILVYKNMSATVAYATTNGRDNAHLPAGIGYEWARAHHPEWFLRSADGAAIQWSDYLGLWPMDVRSPAYQQQWAANVSVDVITHGWDGVMVDDALTRLSHPTVAGSVARQIPDDQAQLAATGTFLGAVGSSLLAKHLLVVPNASVTWDNYASVYRRWASVVSGWLFEYWAKWGLDDSYPRFTGPDLQLRLDIMTLVQGTGRFLVPVTYSGSSSTATQVYHRAAFLLVWDGGRSSSIFSTTEPNTSQVVPAAQTDLGTPTGARFVTPGGVLRRDFTGGLVLLNPDRTRTVTVALPSGYATPLGGVPLLPLPPATAAVLARAR